MSALAFAYGAELDAQEVYEVCSRFFDDAFEESIYYFLQMCEDEGEVSLKSIASTLHRFTQSLMFNNRRAFFRALSSLVPDSVHIDVPQLLLIADESKRQFGIQHEIEEEICALRIQHSAVLLLSQPSLDFLYAEYDERVYFLKELLLSEFATPTPLCTPERNSDYFRTAIEADMSVSDVERVQQSASEKWHNHFTPYFDSPLSYECFLRLLQDFSVEEIYSIQSHLKNTVNLFARNGFSSLIAMPLLDSFRLEYARNTHRRDFLHSMSARTYTCAYTLLKESLS